MNYFNCSDGARGGDEAVTATGFGIYYYWAAQVPTYLVPPGQYLGQYLVDST
jgi:hypothetical protein